MILDPLDDDEWWCETDIERPHAVSFQRKAPDPHVDDWWFGADIQNAVNTNVCGTLHREIQLNRTPEAIIFEENRIHLVTQEIGNAELLRINESIL